jgi:16S rRNA (uracil1498-N3)-methyltransferase
LANQVYIDPKDIRKDQVVIRGREAGHLIRVLRIQQGDALNLFDGLGGRFHGVVSDVGREEISVKLKGEVPQETSCEEPCITLVQALPKQKGMETIVSQCTQVGVHRIIGVLTQRTEVKIDLENPGRKLERWRRVALESAKQCKIEKIPVIEEPLYWEDYLRRLEPHDLSLIGVLETDTESVKKVLQDFKASNPSGTKSSSVCIAIGPEGDFTQDEVALSVKHGFKPVSLGPRVLRATTAATVLCALVHHELRITPQ